MDEEKPPKELIQKIFYMILILSIPVILFPTFNKIGSLMIIGIIFFLFIFSIKDNQSRKQHQNNILSNDDSWFKSKYNLTKEIP